MWTTILIIFAAIALIVVMWLTDNLDILGGVAAIAGLVGVLVFGPVITFWLGWFGGWILKLCVGELIANGLNLLFNTTRFTPDFIPLACATLCIVGGYFKSTHTNSTNLSFKKIKFRRNVT